MAMLQNHSKSSSSNYGQRTSSENNRHGANTQASAYAVDVATMALTGFHFSTRGAQGAGWCGFEAPPGGVPSPPPSPDGRRRPGLKARSRSGDAAHHVTEECERLFCETMKAVFLVEKNTGRQNSLVTDVHEKKEENSSEGGVAIPHHRNNDAAVRHGIPTPSPSPDGRVYAQAPGMVKEYVEVWDYTGGARFRGFVAERNDERSMFIFFDKEVTGKDLKPGLMALLELASSESFDCSQLVVCVDRGTDGEDVKDLGWVGFELTMLDEWAGEKGCISESWVYLKMDV
ncbi:hypothetical protein LTR62_000873 [Meristemomyces frigidus]|uniref:Ornithine decarboxylase antizyme n=1 Tax=Meristemomyces frigidus TaxID=1508187 RepID=A0AAN7TTP1_9PEZI|nr:hypothetical protein LTR62_000873 [Meristemomyces frigidus]